ncbi:CHAP domain-containing protein [Aeromicrobium sp.]|uniref:CHAP domain-containing protein n=1 Tax=Aeromicrobium sp. TaxID=1871063 RepID=UPI003C3A352B
MLFFAALLTPALPAQATSSLLCTGYSSCGDKGYSNFGYSTHQSTSYWRMYTGTNCTNYVAYRLVTTNGMPNVRPASGVGNAQDWGFAMASITDGTPVAGSVAWWGRTGHHVAYVEKVVSPDEIWVSESNWSGAFDWRKIIRSGSGWPDGFIHFADPDRQIISKTAPAILDEPHVGAQVLASGGSWSPTGNTYDYQWLADSQPISGAIGRSYVPTVEQNGQALSVRVTASRPDYPTVTATSPRRTIQPGTVTNLSPPGIAGSPQVDQPLTASTAGRWTPTGNVYTYQWLADGAKVAGATDRSFVPAPEHAGRQITFAVTATRPGYYPVTAVSEPTANVAPGTLTSTAPPTISGTPQVGSPLTAQPGTWSRSDATYSYQWSVGDRPVQGATASTYTPRAADLDLPVSVEVVATRPGYLPAGATSAPSTPVVRGTMVSQTTPWIGGVPRVGAQLIAHPGSWSAPASFTYQWSVAGQAVPGATGKTFTPAPAQRGAGVHVRVTARAAGYSSSAADSRETAAIGYGRITFSRSPRISGTLSRGAVVAVDPGTYTPSAARLRYQWLRDGKSISGATGRTRRLNTADRGRLMSVRVSYSSPGYTSRTVTTAARRAAR